MSFGTLRAIPVAFALALAFALSTAAEAQQATGTVQVNVSSGEAGGGTPLEGAQVFILPVDEPRSDDTGTTTNTDANGSVTKDLPPGNYGVSIITKDGKHTYRFIRIEKGKKASVSVGTSGMAYGVRAFDDVADETLKLCYQADDAALKCDQAAYDKAMAAIQSVRKDFAQTVTDLGNVVSQEAEATGLPSDPDQLKTIQESIAGAKQAGSPVDAQQAANVNNLVNLASRLQNAKDKLKKIDREIAAITPFDKNKCPKKAATADQPQTTPPPKESKEQPKDNKEQPKDSPKASVLPPATNQAAVAAGGIDPCLVGTWRSQSAVIPGIPGQSGGSGIVMTIGADGTEAIDYGGMQPLRDFAGGTNLWSGKAMGQIAASDGTVSLRSTGSSALTLTYTPKNGAVRTNAMDGLGPAGLGYSPTDHSYACSATTLTFKQFAFVFTFSRQSGAR